MRHRSSKKANGAHRGIVDGRYEAGHRVCVAAAHFVFEREPLARLGIEAVGIDKAVGEVFYRMAGGAGIEAIAGRLARKARCVFVRVEDEVVPVLDRLYELAVGAEVTY